MEIHAIRPVPPALILPSARANAKPAEPAAKHAPTQPTALPAYRASSCSNSAATRAAQPSPPSTTPTNPSASPASPNAPPAYPPPSNASPVPPPNTSTTSSQKPASSAAKWITTKTTPNVYLVKVPVRLAIRCSIRVRVAKVGCICIRGNVSFRVRRDTTMPLPIDVWSVYIRVWSARSRSV